eukprot:TRINITY_DN15492_c0_g1_i1.p1 TRINITY_DN15492_c0_g1~~TRINITY_DN15492_c0_g1_i1.p1  ORF type:complete len:203 (+),score=32.16 TRINITY_DN15492_c0_g1_i1:31-639(+)
MKPLEDYQKGAENNDPVSQLYLSYLYQYGTLCEKDEQKTFDLLIKAEQNGSMVAKARRFYFGFGVFEDCKTSLKIMKECIEMERTLEENTILYHMLGYLYEYGEAGETNIPIAKEYYEKAIKLGNHHCMYNLGLIYKSGKGGTKDVERSISLFEEASVRNNERALYELGLIYLKGIYVKKDTNKAICLFDRSAKKKKFDFHK